MAANKDRDKKKRNRSPDEPIVRDKRKIDPETGEPRNASEADEQSADGVTVYDISPDDAETVDTATDDGATTDGGEASDDESVEGSSSDGPASDNSVSDDSATPEGDAEPERDGEAETISDEELLAFLENAKGPAESSTGGSSSEHLDDLKRVQAEYANYRKRVDRDRFVARELAVAEVMTGILPVLDDLDLAHAHGDLEGSPLELVAQKIRTSFERYGLVQVGAVGEPFDPKLHEAIAQLPTKDVTVETIADVVLPGYLLGERLLRAAKVAVSVPED